MNKYLSSLALCSCLFILPAQAQTPQMPKNQQNDNTVCVCCAAKADNLYNKALEIYNRGNHAQAWRLFLQAAQNGSAEAQYRVARVLFGIDFTCRVEGTQTNIPEALEWLEKAARQGNRLYMYELAVAYSPYQDDAGHFYYYQGAEVPAKAAYWYCRSAEKGYIPAMYRASDYLLSGTGIAKDSQKGLRWLTTAASDPNEVAAQLDLADRYMSGRGITRNYSQALHWYKTVMKTCASTCVMPKYWDYKIKAARALEQCYTKGLGTTKDSAMATKYAKIAQETEKANRAMIEGR